MVKWADLPEIACCVTILVFEAIGLACLVYMVVHYW